MSNIKRFSFVIVMSIFSLLIYPSGKTSEAKSTYSKGEAKPTHPEGEANPTHSKGGAKSTYSKGEAKSTSKDEAKSTHAKGGAKLIRSKVDIEIVFSKKQYEIREPLDGEILIRSRSLNTLPGTFEMELYQDGVLKVANSVNIGNIIQGKSRFPLRILGIPPITENTASEGDWTLVILQSNVGYQYRSEANFKIIPATSHLKDKQK